MDRCEQCGTKTRDAGVITPTGRSLCGSCAGEYLGAVVGAETGDLGTAIAIGYSEGPGRGRGAWSWIRRVLGRDEADRG